MDEHRYIFSLRSSQFNKKINRFNSNEISATELSLGRWDKFSLLCIRPMEEGEISVYKNAKLFFIVSFALY